MWRLDPIYVSFRISERELLETRQALERGALEAEGGAGKDDLRVALELIDESPFPQEGVINYRSARVDPATGTAEVRAEFPNPGEALLPGQFVRVRVLGLTRRDVLAVPQRAVQMSGTSTVYVVNDEDVALLREIVLSTWEGTDWIVESGLSAGERVIVDGIQKVRPGAEVKPVLLAAQ
jgi:membrane fusion protein (multidrug efflux system)